MTATDAAKAAVSAFLAEHASACRTQDGGALAADRYAMQCATVDIYADDLRPGGLSKLHDRAAGVIVGEGAAGEPAARRFITAAVEQGRPIPAPLQKLTAAIVKGEAGPAKIKFRDILIAEAVNIARRHGLKLTRNSGNENAVSACSLVADTVGRAGLASIGEKAVEYIWRRAPRSP